MQTIWMWLSFIRLIIVVNLKSSHFSFITCTFQDQNTPSKCFQRTGSCKRGSNMITFKVWQVSGSIPKYLKLQNSLLKTLQLRQPNVWVHRTTVNRFYTRRSIGGFYHGGLFPSWGPQFKSLCLGPMWQILQEVVGSMRTTLKLSLLHLLQFTF